MPCRTTENKTLMVDELLGTLGQGMCAIHGPCTAGGPHLVDDKADEMVGQGILDVLGSQYKDYL